MVDYEVTKELVEQEVIVSLANALVKSIVEDIVSSFPFNVEPFTEEELDQIRDKVQLVSGNTFEEMKEQFIRTIKTESLTTTVRFAVQEILDNRPKYYKFTCHYSGDIEFVVKARNFEEAENFANDLSHYDLQDYIDTYDAEFDSPCFDSKEEDFDEVRDDFFDATI